MKYLEATTEKDITPGVIAVIQSFGSRINFHPHLNFLVTEGGTDKKGQFHKVIDKIIKHLNLTFKAVRPTACSGSALYGG